jgi:catechol 2,3-dioxygenase-like lactoylglutathione lyase family enzyme
VAIRTAGFDHVHLHVDDVERALTFYRAVFGAEEAFRVGERLVFIRLGGAEIVSLDGRPNRTAPPATSVSRSPTARISTPQWRRS